MEGWLQTMLSAPCTFLRLDTHDKRYAKAMSIRAEFAGTATAVTHSGRQICYNIWGFKCLKEAQLKSTFGAQAIASFYEQKCQKRAAESFTRRARSMPA